MSKREWKSYVKESIRSMLALTSKTTIKLLYPL